MEHGPYLQLIYPLKMVIFHGYVSLPEGNTENGWKMGKDSPNTCWVAGYFFCFSYSFKHAYVCFFTVDLCTTL